MDSYNRMSIDKVLMLVRETKDVVHLYVIVCANSQYYLIASFRDYDHLRQHRLDRITQIEMLDESARSITNMPGFEKGLNILNTLLGSFPHSV